MAAASNYLENNIINATLRGGTFPKPASVYVSLHTADPNDQGANEVNTTQWPSYARQDSTKGEGTLAQAWTAPVNGVTKNTKQLLFPVYNGAGSLTITHFGLFDAPTGGNLLIAAPLDQTRIIQPGDVFVVDIEKLTVQVL